MANQDRPRGFQPVAMLDGSEIPVKRMEVSVGNGTNIFVGDVLYAVSGGTVAPATAGKGDTCIGVCTGLYDSDGVPVGAPNSSVSTKYLPATTAGYADVALALPHAVFRAQADSGHAPSASDRFNCTDHVAGAGNTTLATSGHELDANGNTAATAQFKILEKVDEPNNDWAEHVDLLVLFNESFWFEAVNGV